MFRNITVFSFFLLFGFFVFSQKKNASSNVGDKNIAKQYFDNQNYKLALDEYLLLLKVDSNNAVYQYNTAICMLNCNVDRKKAVSLLEKVVKQAKPDPNAYYYLGRAYQLNYKFDEAISAYEQYESAVKKDLNLIPAKRQMDMCDNAKELIQKPLNIKIENLGNEINTNAPDYNPYINENETFMVFSSKRSGNLGNLIDNEGFNTSDIFSSENNAGWTKPKRLPPVVNSPLSDDCSGLTADGITMSIRYDNNKMLGDIMFSELKGKSFLRPMNASAVINTDFEESSACLSPDKQTMYFASNKEGGIGGKDLYYSKRLPSGDWSQAVNMGSSINTEYDEDFPYVAPDGESIYFCSTGHNSMGGFDIFSTKLDKETYTFSDAQNIGYPINTPEDEKTISFTKSGRFAYYAAFRKDGAGDRDIYRIIFNDIAATKTAIVGIVNYGEATAAVESETQEETSGETLEVAENKPAKSTAAPTNHQTKITVYDKTTKAVVGKYAPNQQSKRFVILLNPGNYILKFESLGFKTFETEMNIADREQNFTEITKDITLIKTSE